MISRKSIDQVIEIANDNIVEVVGDYVSLKRRGANYIGCCPFHSEKTPSFSVSPAKGFCYCFGCHKGGNSVTFLMEVEKLEFPDAIRHLAKRFGIPIEETQASPEQTEQQRQHDALTGVMEWACRVFEENLRQTEEGQALGMTYFRGRQFRDDTMATFRLGYSMDLYDGLIQRAAREGYKEDLLVRAGLISVHEDTGRKNDRFRGRVMFPIQNASGKVVAFGARVLDARTKGVSVKYLNSPETELYVKSDIVYGIYQARAEMGRADKCFLVEGYTDVISMHQSGIKNVVASSGTALTPNQIRLIKRFTSNITVLYDGDSAGIHASLRGIDLILHEGMNVRVLLLPGGQDPDEFARTHTDEEFQQYVSEHETDFISFQAERLMADAAGDPIRSAQTIHTIVASIAEVQDVVMREVYVKQCAKIMDVSQESVFSALQKKLAELAVAQRNQEIAQRRREEFARTGQAVAPGPMTQNAAIQAQPTVPTPYVPGPQAPDDGWVPSPEEMMAAGMMSPVAVPVQPQKPAPAVRPETELREVIRYLVTYPQNVVGTDPETGVPVTVAQCIVSQLEADCIVSSEPVLTRIVDFFRQAPDITKVSVSDLMDVQDSEITTFVASIVGGRQELSHIHSKYTVIEKEEDMLPSLIERSLNELRLNRLLTMIDELMAEMAAKEKAGAPEEEIMEIMERLSECNAVKRELSLEMGERAVLSSRV